MANKTCLKCDEEAEEGSNYCAEHKPGRILRRKKWKARTMKKAKKKAAKKR